MIQSRRNFLRSAGMVAHRLHGHDQWQNDHADPQYRQGQSLWAGRDQCGHDDSQHHGCVHCYGHACRGRD